MRAMQYHADATSPKEIQMEKKSSLFHCKEIFRKGVKRKSFKKKCTKMNCPILQNIMNTIWFSFPAQKQNFPGQKEKHTFLYSSAF